MSTDPGVNGPASGVFFFNYFMSTAWDGLNCQGLEAGLQRYFNYI